MEEQKRENLNNIPGCSDFVEDENLNKLEEIGKEIEVLEDKIKALPNAEQLDTSKYNRKQRRRLQRNIVHNEKSKNKQIEQKANSYVTRREFAVMFQSIQKIRDRLYYVDILTAAIEKLIIEKTIVTEEEIGEFIKRESDKAMAFQEIQKEVGNYETRLKKCLNLQIDPQISNIGQQIYEANDINIDEKLRLAKEYNLEILLKALETQMIIQKQD